LKILARKFAQFSSDRHQRSDLAIGNVGAGVLARAICDGATGVTASPNQHSFHSKIQLFGRLTVRRTLRHRHPPSAPAVFAMREIEVALPRLPSCESLWQSRGYSSAQQIAAQQPAAAPQEALPPIEITQPA